MERRGFFKSIAGLFVAMKAGDLLELPTYKPDLALLPVYGEGAINAQLTRACKMFAESVGASVNGLYANAFAGKDAKLGMTLQLEKLVVLDRQLGFDFKLDPRDLVGLSDDDLRARYVDPMARFFGREFKKHPPRAFGRLPLPMMSVVNAARVEYNGVSVRGLHQGWQLWCPDDGPYVRFDVLFG